MYGAPQVFCRGHQVTRGVPQMRMSQASANSSPPPRANPSTAAIVGREASVEEERKEKDNTTQVLNPKTCRIRQRGKEGAAQVVTAGFFFFVVVVAGWHMADL